ncbi:hypothetical protein [Nocardia nova]|uniref:hypothetical protein n=1 Tax=Nocardia nova TaxID=37330 RepID=UPI0033ECCF92
MTDTRHTVPPPARRSHTHTFAKHPISGLVICACGLTEVAAHDFDPDYVSACCGGPIEKITGPVDSSHRIHCDNCGPGQSVVHHDQWQSPVCAACGRTSAETGGSVLFHTRDGDDYSPYSAQSCKGPCADQVHAMRNANGVLEHIPRSAAGHLKTDDRPQTSMPMPTAPETPMPQDNRDNTGTSNIAFVIHHHEPDPFTIDDGNFARWLAQDASRIEDHLPDEYDGLAATELVALVTDAIAAGVLNSDSRLNLQIDAYNTYKGFTLMLSNRGDDIAVTAGFTEICFATTGLTLPETVRHYLDHVVGTANNLLQQVTGRDQRHPTSPE